jgi:anaerobic magnesium-protoporphyrin IX monomethyl ester cyclase
MAKILLIQPNEDIRDRNRKTITFTPLSLIYLGTAIEDKHTIKIYDRNVNNNDQDFIKFLKEYNPQIVGLTSVVSTILFDVIHLGKLIKKILPESTIIVGGVHATIDPDSLLNEPYVDYVLRGEGEEAFLEFCNTFDKNPAKLKTLKNINKNPIRPFVDLNKLKLPNYNLLDLDKYQKFFVNLTRGCIANCSFCYNVQMWGKNCNPFVRAYSTENTIELMRRVVEEYKRKNFHIIDDNFLFFKSRCIEVCKFLEKYKVGFYACSRADSINDEILIALKKAGCHTIAIGIESGSQKMLDLLNKKVTLEQNINAIKLCKKYEIKGDALFMIGLPTETVTELNETIKFIKKYDPDVANMHIYNPMPAKLFDDLILKGRIKKPTTLEEWANHGGLWVAFNNNVSEIPEKKLREAIKEIERFHFLRKKIKRTLFWIRKGEYDYVLRKMKEILNRKEDPSSNF